MNNIETLQKPKLKKMPYACTKVLLKKMYMLDLTQRELRNGINGIIKENRGLPKMHPVRLRQVRHNELMEFVEVFGAPRGYEDPFDRESAKPVIKEGYFITGYSNKM
jgi:hypothetical protein